MKNWIYQRPIGYRLPHRRNNSLDVPSRLQKSKTLAISQLTNDIKSISPHPLRQINNSIGSFLAREKVVHLLEAQLDCLVHERFEVLDIAHAVGTRQRAAELVMIILIG